MKLDIDHLLAELRKPLDALRLYPDRLARIRAALDATPVVELVPWEDS